jgi:capsular exopolysaccharide synthesis family protein
VENKGLFQNNKSINIKEVLFKYLASWPLFIVSIIICLTAGILYTRYTPPKYIAYTSFVVKGADNDKGNSNDLIESAISGKRQINMNNEILLLKSKSLMQRVVAKNNFNISYFIQGKILKTDVYLDVPFRFVIKSAVDNIPVMIKIKTINQMGGILSYGNDKNNKKIRFQWNTPFSLNGKTFLLLPNGNIKDEECNYEIRWESEEATAADLVSRLSVGAFDAKTSVLELSILCENLQKGKDVLNALFSEFNLSDIESRNKLSESTVRFIDERLNAISSELRGVEGNLESYRGSNSLLDVTGQSAQSLQNTNTATKTIKDLSIQQGVVSMISSYFNSGNSGKLVPSSLGLDDPVLGSLITQYNDLQLKKDRESQSVTANSLVMEDINAQVTSVKNSISESLNSISKNLKLQESNLQEQKSQDRRFLSSLPHNERILQEIKRKQSITEGLYLYLLQKREEAAISSTSLSVSHYQQIDPANGFGPVEPNTKNILTYSALLGLLLPIGFIYIKASLNDKIANRDDISKATHIPVIGDINHVAKQKNRLIIAGSRDLLGEQFRIIRTNLSSLNKNCQVILVASGESNEGKSFVCLNLASVLAVPGRKVALLQFDMRRPGKDMLNLKNDVGLAQYLTGAITDLEDLYYSSKQLPTLHVYTPGIVQGNPADLLLTENMARLFSDLRQYYDYIVVDTPPVGLVSDAFVLSEYADAVLFVIRQRHTLKKQLSFLNELYKTKKITNIGLILNDVKTGGKYGYYGYGYGNKNGYYTNAPANNKKEFNWVRGNSIEIQN